MAGKELLVGYEIKVRVYWPAEMVEIEHYLDEINGEGCGQVDKVVTFNNRKDADTFLQFKDL